MAVENGKVAVVTGAGSGIGKAAARLLAKHGYRVGALGQDEKNTQQTVNEIRRENGEAMTLVADVSNPGQMQQVYDRVMRQWGRLDVVFANAGINGV